MFEEVEHTGEMAFRVVSDSKEDIVRDSLKALMSVYRGGNEKQKNAGRRKMRIESEGIDFTDTLISLLNEVVFIFDAKKLVLSRVLDVDIEDGGRKISVDAEFEKFSPSRHNPEIYIKAVARGGAELKKREDGKYELFFIVDV